MKKILSVFFTIGLLFCFVGCITEKDDGNYVAEDFIDSSYDTSFTPQNRAQEIVYNMQFGWNLGNTLDATASLQNAGLSTEIGWGQPKTTQEMIKGLKNLGIKTIRIPISWHNHISKVSDYTIDSKWMNRVKQIVDWAYDEGMYVIINIHHDNASKGNFSAGKGFYPSEDCKEESLKFITRVWEQVSETFKNYDEKLVFEILNEPRLQGNGEHEWSYNSGCSTCKDAMNSLNEFNQNALDTIRASGGNNANRLVMVPSIAASPNAAFNSDFKLPIDSAENALALSVHMYTPYDFAMGAPGDSVFTNSHKKDLDWYFSELNKLYVSKGIPVVIGEMGATNKDNLKHRAAWFGYFVQHSRRYGMTACVWDNGSWDTSNIAHGDKNDNDLDDKYEEKYGYYNRTKQEWYFPLLMEVALKASEIK